MDRLIRIENGKEEIWYSEEYLIQQIKNAFQGGVYVGLKVEFHAIEPNNREEVEMLVEDFKNLVKDTYQKEYINGNTVQVFRDKKF